MAIPHTTPLFGPPSPCKFEEKATSLARRSFPAWSAKTSLLSERSVTWVLPELAVLSTFSHCVASLLAIVILDIFN